MENLVEVEVTVTDALQSMGVPANIKGYHYLRDAIVFLIENDVISSVTHTIYPTVAEEHNDTLIRVERAMRYAIERAWENGDRDVITSYLGYTIKNRQRRPTNGEFIAAISDKLRLDLKRH